MIKNIIQCKKKELVQVLWEIAPEIKQLLKESANLMAARDRFFLYLNDLERSYYNIFSDLPLRDLHIINRNNAKECIRVLKNVIRTENEQLTSFSAIQIVYNLAQDHHHITDEISEGFLAEFIYLFLGITGQSITDKGIEVLDATGREAAIIRSEKLDFYSSQLQRHFGRFNKGTDPAIEKKRRIMKNKILEYFRSTESDWQDYQWQLRHIIKDYKTLNDLIRLEEDEKEGILAAKASRIPFQITPYYLALFNRNGRAREDTLLRSMVIPSRKYCDNIVRNREEGLDMDFMGEGSTSPVDGITRRYPQIVILKPFDSCPQICVYCQRNWEIKDLDAATITTPVIRKAITWIAEHPTISEVLITGGDPLTLSDTRIGSIISRIAAIPHIERIRIGTRMLVTLPQRFTDNLLTIFAKYHQFGKREIALITHFESPMEITSETLRIIEKIRRKGISIYNQQVFTYYNSKRYETCFLRKTLKLSGIEPYYTFNTKGKEETLDFRVPIARIEQERKEEARLLPGITRTDEPVFNVPKLGKSHLRAWQDHEPVMILGNGQRVYRFYPWESKIATVDDYLYRDVSIYDYLSRLHNDGEDIAEYRSIWYYF
ncbi:MAG: KamA family radical SAM protein [bacterium]